MAIKFLNSVDVTGTLTVTSQGGIDIDTAGHSSLTLDRASTSYDNNILFRTAGDTKFRLWQDGNADYLYIRDDDNATNMVTFVKGGNVGIGTTAPVGKLEVAGNFRLSGNGTSNDSYPIHFTNTAVAIARDGNDLDLHGYNAIVFGVSSTVYPTSTERMRITNSGNVGIGTTSPAVKLDILDTVNQTAVRVTNNNYNNYLIQKRRTDNSQILGIQEFGSNGGLALVTGAAQRLNVNNLGNVGIGTTAPATKLDVNGDTIVRGNVGINGATSIDSPLDIAAASTGNNALFQKWYYSPNAETYNLQLKQTVTAGVVRYNFSMVNNSTAYNDVLVLDRGNVGIGTTGPSDGDLTIGTPKLHVAVGGTSGTFNLAARFQSTTSDADNTGTSILINSSNDRGLLIKAGRKDGDREVAYFDVVTSTGNTTNMLTMGKFSSAYNVGIGTTSPSQKLTVNGTIMSTGASNPQLILQDSTHSDITIKGDSGIFSVTNQSAGQNITMLYNGNTGIGTTSPTQKLDVNGNMVFSQRLVANSNQYYVKLGVWSYASTYGIGMTNGFTYGALNNDYAMTFCMNNDSDRGWWWGYDGQSKSTGAMSCNMQGKLKINHSIGLGTVNPSATQGRIDASNDIVAYSTSDIRLKNNIKSIDKALDKVNSIQGIEFDWIEKEEVHGNSGHDIGVIAQEIEEILPDVVTTRDNGYKAVKYEKIVPLLIEAIKDLSKQVDGLKRLI